jgi:hypothetical protein
MTTESVSPRIADTGVCWRMGLVVVRSIDGW